MRAWTPPNKEMKLTRPEQSGASQHIPAVTGEPVKATLGIDRFQRVCAEGRAMLWRRRLRSLVSGPLCSALDFMEPQQADRLTEPEGPDVALEAQRFAREKIR